jgi:metallophosphoesterase (TIGR00282 family)
LKILFIGDIMGRPGREAVQRLLPAVREEYGIDFAIANGENAAGGKGVTDKVAAELFGYGINVLTGGNHSWQNREGFKLIQEEARILRPANFPQGQDVPGRGAAVFQDRTGVNVGVLNLQGRIFMTPLDCPFQSALREISTLCQETKIIIVDFHAEATSEKVSMGWFLDGRVTAVIGTHTHVQTADEQILPQGTAYITDVGMTGPHDGVIGIKKDIVLESMVSRLPVRHQLAEGNIRLNGVIVTIDPDSGRATDIERLSRKIK